MKALLQARRVNSRLIRKGKDYEIMGGKLVSISGGKRVQRELNEVSNVHEAINVSPCQRTLAKLMTYPSSFLE